MRYLIIIILLLIGCKPIEHTTSSHTENTVVKYRDTTFYKAADTVYHVINTRDVKIINKTITVKDTSGRVELRQYIDSMGILHQTLIANQEEYKARLIDSVRTIVDKTLTVREKTWWEKTKDQ